MKKEKIFTPSSDDPRIAFFDRQAPIWDSSEQPPSETVQRLAGHAELLGLSQGEDVLEVGCGTGQLTQWLANSVRPGKVTAVDFSPAMLQKARAKRIDAEFRLADVCRDELGRGRFDMVFCFHSFPHFRDQLAALRNFARSLKAGGRLIVMHLAGSDRINHFHAGVNGPVKGDVLPVGPEWAQLLSIAGLNHTKLIDREDLFFLEAVRDGR